MIRKIVILLALTAGSLSGFAQKATYDQQVADYIEKYKQIAIEEQIRSGVPASITLAQGILETSAGQSELCNNASNHFGIKCKNTWTGETYTYTDDAKDECFRKYQSARVSYADHSDFLKNNKRYSSLFNISPTDYASWAYGLKRCGYATNPQYAQRLIRFIEDYKLQSFTYMAMNNNSNGDDILLASAQPKYAPARSAVVSTVIPGEHVIKNESYNAIAVKNNNADYDANDEIYVEKAAAQQNETNDAPVTDYYKTTTKNGVKGFYARRGDMLLEYAIKNKIRYAKLLEYNDLPDAPLEADMFIYLARKPKTGKSYTHTVENGETLLQISQQEGIQMEQLLAYNHLQRDQEPVPGSVLNLQSPSDKVPDTYVPAAKTLATVNSNTGKAPQLSNDGGFVPGGKKDNRSPVEVGDNDVDAAAPVANRKSDEVVNIANEPAVEDEISTTMPARKQAPQPAPVTKNEKKMSALDKLKAHMDKVVYTDNEYEPKSTRNYDDDNTPVNNASSKAAAAETEDNDEVVTKTPVKKTPAKNQKPVAPKATKTKQKTHTVKKGETLYSIAERYDLTVKELQKLNKITSKNIQPGDKLKVSR